jgi:hypothetical protein
LPILAGDGTPAKGEAIMFFLILEHQPKERKFSLIYRHGGLDPPSSIALSRSFEYLVLNIYTVASFGWLGPITFLHLPRSRVNANFCW